MPKPPQDKPQAVPVPAPPTATKAPVPTGPKSYRKVIVAAIAATFTVGFLFGCCAASVVFWTFPRAQGVLPEGVKGAVDRAAGKPNDDMTFQELEDRLNSSGFHVSRTSSRKVRNSMWYGKRTDGKSINEGQAPDIIHAYEDGQSIVLFEGGYFLVTKATDSKSAKESAASIADTQQRPAFAWGPFVFVGNKEVLDNVKAALAK